MKIYISDETTLNNELYDQLQRETNVLSTKVKLYKQKKKTIVGCMNKINTSIENIKTMESTKVLNDTISELKKALSAVKFNIENTRSLGNSLVEIKKLALKSEEEDIYGEAYHKYLTEIYKKVGTYNTESDELQSQLGENDLTIELFMQNIINYSNFTFPNSEYQEDYIKASIEKNKNSVTISKPEKVENSVSNIDEPSNQQPKRRIKKDITENKFIKNMMVQSEEDHEREKEEYNSLRDLCSQIRHEEKNNIDITNLSKSMQDVVKPIEDDKTVVNFQNSIDNLNTTIAQANKIHNEEEDNIETKTKISIIDKLDNAILEDNNVLLISEKQQKVYLPYKIEDLQDILDKNSKYATLEDVVVDKYIVPMKKYKNTTVSRFKEAYTLKKKKSNGKVGEAINLGMELAFNYNLNPAIISACRNEEQLDEYLDCIDENEMNKFTGFKVQYDIAPMKIHKKNMNEF